MTNSYVEEIWVNSAEGAEITGYSRQYMTRLATIMNKKPEAEREIKLKRRTYGYEMWLPDLIDYIENVGHGPHRKRNPSSS